MNAFKGFAEITQLFLNRSASFVADEQSEDPSSLSRSLTVRCQPPLLPV
jgi:hypothetical protein